MTSKKKDAAIFFLDPATAEALLLHLSLRLSEDSAMLRNLPILPPALHAQFAELRQNLQKTVDHLGAILPTGLVHSRPDPFVDRPDSPASGKAPAKGTRMARRSLDESGEVVELPEGWLCSGAVLKGGESSAEGVMIPLATLPQKAKEPQGTRLVQRPAVILEDEKRLIVHYLKKCHYSLSQGEFDDLLRKLARLVQNAPPQAIALELRVIRQGEVPAIQIEYRSFATTV